MVLSAFLAILYGTHLVGTQQLWATLAATLILSSAKVLAISVSSLERPTVTVSAVTQIYKTAGATASDYAYSKSLREQVYMTVMQAAAALLCNYPSSTLSYSTLR
jgi:hypothetical protein